MSPWIIALLVVVGILLVGFIVLSIVGSKMQKKNAAAQADLRAAAQATSMLVIDKKRMKLKDAGFPQIVLDQTPKYARGAKVPVVKAKIGPQIHTLMCDEKLFDLVPVKKEVRAMLSGIYIVDIKGLRKPLQKDEKPKKKWFSRKKEKEN